MPRTEEKQRPALELRCGGVHIIVQRISPWTVAVIALAFVATAGSRLATSFTSHLAAWVASH
ncbi:hypothetical protein J7E91_19235 [Streptomyces sp. ISL-99]|uniref:hypothetical protein n=1 Tax=Streptomyces sp. ISL-99 TaxID=2819193 RepID=UPI001BEA5498|nr:hypothetical protein [Streptomyces sp. ISL-99]MBT2527499.1 hypothetical protein [Streptomyces sp. ISL-99]